MHQICKDLLVEGPDKEGVLEQLKTGRYTFLVDERGNFRADHMELVEPTARKMTFHNLETMPSKLAIWERQTPGPSAPHNDPKRIVVLRSIAAIFTHNRNSLEAGAVAYRSYGAWYVANPICSTTSSSCPVVYDICNSTYCQVFDTTSAASTVAAAQATASVVVSSDGVKAFFAEYSANTNGLYCPDGQTGQPAANWPCMADPIATGSTGSGHGRGMSQWGSQYWARGKSYQGVTTSPRNWQCIVDHYYNDNGNTTGAGTGLRSAFVNGSGGDGRVAYSSKGGDISTMNADGTAAVTLTSTHDNGYPVWQPGGAQIAFYSGRAGYANGYANAFVMNPDGSGQTQLTTTYDLPRSYSPKGDKLASHTCNASGVCQIYVMGSDGSNRTQITNAGNVGEGDAWPAWSSDGSKIAFVGATYIWGNAVPPEIYVMNADGSNQIQLTYPSTLASGATFAAYNPAWSPDGTRIAFYAPPNTQNSLLWAIWVMNSDGSNLTQITSGSFSDTEPNWSADGKSIFFDRTNGGIWRMNPDGSSQTQVLGAGFEPNCLRCLRFDTL